MDVISHAVPGNRVTLPLAEPTLTSQFGGRPTAHSREWRPLIDNPSPPVARTPSPDCVFWISWVVASTAAIFLGFGILYASTFIAEAVVPGTNEDRLMGGLMLPILGTVLGALQWLVLRARIPKSGWWVLATGVGMLGAISIAGGLVQAISRATGRQWNWDSKPEILVVYGAIGILLALAQLPILWRHFRGFAFWPLFGIVGWLVLGLIIGKSIDRTTDVYALGVVPAAFSGLGLIWLTRSPRGHTIRSA